MTKRLAIVTAQLNPDIGDISGNLKLARSALEQAARLGADLVVLPELFLSGYPPEDLVLRPGLVAACGEALAALAAEHGEAAPGLITGLPWADSGGVFNAAALIDGGRVQAICCKHDLPDYAVFDEKRIFVAGPVPKPVQFRGISLGLPICEDVWSEKIPQALAEQGARMLIAINGSPWRRGKQQLRLKAMSELARSGLPLIYVNRVGGQDELIFDGASFALDGAGKLVQQLPGFETAMALGVWEEAGDGQFYCRQAEIAAMDTGNAEIWRALVMAVRDYVLRSGFESALLGLSGGVDSALAMALCVDALGADKVQSLMLPWRHTSSASIEDARACASALGVAHQEISIEPIMAALSQITSNWPADKDKADLAEENMQARARAIILMAWSNALGPILISTGNRSELASGYATLYGDMCGGYNPLKNLYKSEIHELARWRNQHCPRGALGPGGEVIPERIISRAPSAELRPNQQDSDSLPPYPLLDAILRALIEDRASIDEIAVKGYERKIIEETATRLYSSEYKRRQSPPGPRTGPGSFGRDRRYPIMHRWRDR